MLLLDFLIPVLSFACLAFFVWLVVVAFQRSQRWGWLVLLLSPIAAIVFAFKYWRSAGTPFLGYIATFCSALGLVIYLFMQVGGMELITMAQRMERGDLTEAEAQQLMEQTMIRMQTSGLLSEAEQRKVETIRELFRGMVHEANTEAKPVANPEQTSEAAAAVFAIQPTPRSNPAAHAPRKRQYREVAPDDAHLYLGREAKIVTTAGVERLSVITRMEGDILYFESQFDNGDMAFEMSRHDIRTLHILQ